MSACPHTGNPDKCTCGPGCGCEMEHAPAGQVRSSGVGYLLPAVNTSSDYQTVSVSLRASAYINGQMVPLAIECAACEQPFGVGHVAQINCGEGIWRHTNCADPTLTSVIR